MGDYDIRRMILRKNPRGGLTKKKGVLSLEPTRSVKLDEFMM